MDNRYFSQKVVEWYLENKRNLPWRNTTDPYKVWLSEIILQQTRVQQGLPYYEKFITTFPTIFHLARATEQQVLRSWQGLGYYTRARNLHACARKLVSEQQGKFPRHYADLLKLPGVGPYTAAAIASICYDERVAVVDGNVFRVLGRVFGIDEPINSGKGKKKFAQLADQLIQNAPPAHYNQAVMEFGALFCTPKNPGCEICPLKKNCFAFSKNLQTVLPVKIRKKSIRRRYFYYFVFKKNNALGMKKRTDKDIWNGLYDFHLVEHSRPTKPHNLLKAINIKSPHSFPISSWYKHELSHQVIFARFIVAPYSNNLKLSNNSLHFYSIKKAGNLPKPRLITRFMEDYRFL